MVVELVWESKELRNASFSETQFWTENERGNLVNLKYAYGADLLDIRVW